MVSDTLRKQLGAAQEQAERKWRDRQRIVEKLRTDVERQKAEAQQARTQLAELENSQRDAANLHQELLDYQKQCADVDLSDRLAVLAGESAEWLPKVEGQRAVVSRTETELCEGEARLEAVLEGCEVAHRNWQQIASKLSRANQAA